MPAFHQARIFDTLFFLAEAPPGEWRPTPQPGECEAVLWIGAAELLQRIAAGEATAIFPTLRNLERLAQFASVAEAAPTPPLMPLRPSPVGGGSGRVSFVTSRRVSDIGHPRTARHRPPRPRGGRLPAA